jgi:hypothetical protein
LTNKDVKRIQKITSKEEQILSILHEVQKSKTKPFFLWHLHFSDVFDEKGGFDIVIANPPYIDSESMVHKQKVIREYISSTYRLTKGNWDIYIAFFELALGLTRLKGVISFITPDKWISKPFGETLRREILKGIHSLVKTGREVFESVNVDSIVTIIAKKPSNILRIYNFKNGKIALKNSVDKRVLKSPFTFDFLFSQYLDLIQKIESMPAKLQGNLKCESACATSDAYKLKPLLRDLGNKSFSSDKQFKVINTGTVDKYISRWGRREMTYLGKKYLRPIVSRKEFLKTFQNTYSKKALKPKIIIKGLTLLDACIDINGHVIPGKSTLVITGGNIEDLKFILGVINSKLPLFYIKEKYPSFSYNQGINFTKEMINELPIPEITKAKKKTLLDLVNKIIQVKKKNGTSEAIKSIQKQINHFVYKLYKLEPEEVETVENSIK